MMHRLLLTFGITLALAGAAAVYSVLMQSLIPREVVRVEPAAAILDSEPLRPLENVRVAATYLRDHAWTAESRYLLRTQQAYLYTDGWEPEGKEGRVRFTPFAMAWVSINKSTGKEEAVTVVSESALLKFSGSLEMSNPDPGRVVFAALEGRTQVRGPDGMQLDGRNFYFSESAARLWSDLPVSFAYAGNRGSANKFQADLIPHVGPPGKDRPHIYGVQHVRLSQNVKMDLQLAQKGDPLLLKMKCAGNFEYAIDQQTAVFTNDVWAFRQTGPEQFDSIRCDRLTALFGAPDLPPAKGPTLPAAGAQPEYQKLEGTLKFRRLLAESVADADSQQAAKPVKLSSMQYQLVAFPQQLVYDGEQRVIVLRDPTGVRVQQGKSQMLSPEILLQLGAGQTLVGALCSGPGWVNVRDAETNAVVFAADWKRHLRHHADDATKLDEIELLETASFRYPSQQAALGAEVIRVWLSGMSQGSLGALAPKTATTEKPAATVPRQPKPKVEPRRLEAERAVVLVSPQLVANCQKLEGTYDSKAEPRVGLSKPARPQATGGSPAKSAAANPTNPFDVSADVIKVTLVPTVDGQADLSELWTEGHVVLQQSHGTEKEPLRIAGNLVHVLNNGGVQQVAHISGHPATVRDQGLFLEASSIHLDREENRLWVDGQGLLQLPVTKDLDGHTLADKAKLDVTWKERMAFDGQAANFVGQAVAVLGDRRMMCQRMDVELDQQLSFTMDRKAAVDPQLLAVHCYDDVEFQNSSRAENSSKLVEIQRAKVWELHVNRETGELRAQGPGWMQMWRRTQSTRNMLSPTQGAQANRPMQADLSEWEFTKVKFDGTMTGNLHRRYTSFRDRVEIVHGPVQHPQQTIERDALPKKSGFMRCQELQVMQAAAEGDLRGQIQLVGQGDADIEGQGFFAQADQISFDQSKGTYMLRGFGKNLARLWHQDGTGQDARETAVQRMEFNPDSKTLRVDGITGGEGGR